MKAVDRSGRPASFPIRLSAEQWARVAAISERDHTDTTRAIRRCVAAGLEVIEKSPAVTLEALIAELHDLTIRFERMQGEIGP